MALVRFRRRMPPSAFPGFAPFPGMSEMEQQMRRMFDDDLLAPLGENAISQPIGWMPAVEIVENPKELMLTAELPGMKQDDVDVSLEDGLLTIRGEKTEERTEDGQDRKYHLVERTYGSFQRSFTLPRTVDAARITAAFKDGVLMVRLPKTAEAKAKGRKIVVGAP